MIDDSPAPAPSARLRRTMLLLLPGLSHSVDELWADVRLRTLYPRYLVALHTMVRASVPLMQEALEVTNSKYLDTPCGVRLAAYLTNHIPEESGHDEWLLEDLAQLGYPSSVATTHFPSPAVAAMVGAQYYYVRHVHPCVLLGYISVLEGYPPSAAMAERGSELTGYPKIAFRTIRKHANLDPHHKLDLETAIDEMQLDDKQLSMISANALLTIDYVHQLIRQLTGDDLSSRLTSGPT
jgi:hypothetical protein